MFNYAEGLKYQREINGYTQNSLSKAIGISQQKISYYESGKHAPPIDDCIRLADFYGITLNELVGRDNYIPQITGTRKQSAAEELSDTENEILKLFRKLPANLQKIILATERQFVREEEEKQAADNYKING